MEPVPTHNPPPRPPISFVDAIALGFKKYATFKGVARRSEFWYWTLFTVLVGMVAGTLDNGVATALPNFSAINDVTSIALFIPTLAVTVRRFRDAGTSPWLILLQLVPLVLFIALIVSAFASAVPFFSQYSDAEINDMFNEFVDSGTGPLMTALESGVFNGVAFFALLVFAVSIAIGVWQLVVLCRPTKTYEQGNRLVAPLAPSQNYVAYPPTGDDGGTTS